MDIADITALLGSNPYPGRGIVVGQTPDATHAVFAYFIMGRSQNSRNRVLCVEGDSLYTRPFDERKVKDPSLIIYRAARFVADGVVVTNGDQTDTICDALQNGKSFVDALSTRTYEPDAPSYTPRISAMLCIANGGFRYLMSILRKQLTSDECERAYFDYTAQAGVGHLLHTYQTDGDPLPSFVGAPRAVQMADDIRLWGDRLWSALNEENKIALYVCYIDCKTRQTKDILYNKYTK